jgi:(4S)-4-hydroxy-5-phosphonooxypentane-2,3-dione isomerase
VKPVHVVMILLTVKPELADEFERVLLHNARESVATDPGCLRFDVSQQADDPTRWMIQEVYERPEAHAAHRQSPHFFAFQAVADRAVVEKTVLKGVGKHIP